MESGELPMLLIDRVMEEWWYSNDARTSLPQNYIAEVQLGTHQQMWIEFVDSFPPELFPSSPVFPSYQNQMKIEFYLSLINNINGALVLKPNGYENLIKS